MNAREIAAMAEATRLTRQGRLLEATALIQQTLASPAVARQAPDAPSAGEGTGGAPDRRPAVPLAMGAGQETQPRRIHPGWMTRRAAPRRGAQALRRTHTPGGTAAAPSAR